MAKKKSLTEEAPQIEPTTNSWKSKHFIKTLLISLSGIAIFILLTPYLGTLALLFVVLFSIPLFIFLISCMLIPMILIALLCGALLTLRSCELQFNKSPTTIEQVHLYDSTSSQLI